MVIQAIQTEYKGYLFRSRLEARWAVFFDALGIDWIYEPEGYELSNGERYLPDFWLDTVNMWAEVKPKDLSEIERNKAEMLVKGTGHPCLLLIGVPENKPYCAIDLTYWYDENDERFETSDTEYCLTNYHDYPQDEGRFYCAPGSFDLGGDAYWSDTEDAAKVAKQARFEHGESP